MTDSADIAIIGGGAAGLAAAIFAGQASQQQTARRIVILDGAKSLGAKILVSGGGRCNVTHDSVSPEDFNGSRPVVRNILAAFPVSATIDWFALLGVELKREETGKLFPVANSARVVLTALLRQCGELGVEILCGHRVTGISTPTETDPCFTVQHTGGGCVISSSLSLYPGGERGGGSGGISETYDPKMIPSIANGTGQNPHPTPPPEYRERELEKTACRLSPAPTGGAIRAARVIMATGGRSLPRSGSDGSGWELVRRLGHTVTPTYAALAPLLLSDKMFHASLAGISHEVQLETFANGPLIDRRRGSLLWTHFGISGPVVMDASRHWVMAHESGAEARMQCNLLPGETFEPVDQWLVEQATSRAKALIASVIAMRLPERVAKAIIIHTGIDPATMCGQLSRQARRLLVGSLTALPLPVTGHRGWNFAEVTAGGVPLAEINYRTMESRKVPGLYLIGEMLDCDGRIGGFNFQWAWATGHLAGKAARWG